MGGGLIDTRSVFVTMRMFRGYESFSPTFLLRGDSDSTKQER
ncbi:hypothetical protein RE6C_02277 [Rhodopirellula europaea 6C]|uniref:Uncharacterized protein n=1 Tax=Rhodopirellula europaea 6C TaxID=1263867 RepID=M2B4A3_9BACT|nr:hypothetical protein RE6C_02277 [Rhodopirellula europaea 6C]